MTYLHSEGHKWNVLIIGSGGREHSLAWKVAQSPLLKNLYIAPGNPGTARHGVNIPVPYDGKDSYQMLGEFALEKDINLVIVGPEVPLAEGLADFFQQMNVPVFGPLQAAARIESSKAFAKEFMVRNAIPTARYANFDCFEPAVDFLRNSIRDDSLGFPWVIKASGLAAGKGVILPQTLAEAESVLYSLLVEGILGSAGNQVLLEEKLAGEEVSLLAFTDGYTVKVMPPAQDHKRLLDGDRGPNTGGMGAFSPAAICSAEYVDQISKDVLQRAVDGMRGENIPFVGVLYAGMILTETGPKVLEFNCRFGDPETQALLPLLKSDLLEIALACTRCTLSEINIEWDDGAAACVVLASEGYPGKPVAGRTIRGLNQNFTKSIVFHAGTKQAVGNSDLVLTAGGRVLGVTGLGKTISSALANAYKTVDQIHFEGMQYRKDIGFRSRRS